MLRRAAIRKALIAGAAGAVAWELVLRPLIALGLPMMDIVWMLGTMMLGDAPPWQWWPAGLVLHAMVGAIWAVFYVYFFWSELPWRPASQGVAFSLLPTLLAGLIMVPQMGWMHPRMVDGAMPQPGVFAWRLNGWGGPATAVLGHLVYGLTLGSLYRRPVGYRPGRAPRPAWLDRRRLPKGTNTPPDDPPPLSQFMFATGIECSYPTIDGGRYRMDELEATEHYRNWQRDLELVREIGLRHVRYGPPLHCIHLGPGKYDWSFMDDVCEVMRRLEIVPIMDLCHFGVPDWLENFQNREFPDHFAEYAAAFAKRYPWVRLYTPVNEMYITARMSALDGMWNEQLRSEAGFFRATCNIAKACVLAMQAILNERPDAIFINSESSEFFQPCCPDPEIQRIADLENQRRFVPLDLLLRHPIRSDILQHMQNHGIGREEYDWFLQQDMRRHIVLGIDYYITNERLINSQGKAEGLGELFGWYVITRQYHNRYQRPIMHTETNCPDAHNGPGWLWRKWHNVQLMRNDGVPVVGFTWYGLLDSVDWNVALAKPEGNVNPVGLFDLNRQQRPVAQAYRHLLEMYQGHVPPPAQNVLEVHQMEQE
jgi:beta-glucosidase/6-phospho-beta-glucosidase/beta-galactosidase